MRKTGLFLPVFMSFLIPGVLHADETREIIVYNEFSPIVTALKKISLITASGDYRMLFFGISVLGMLFAAMAVYYKILTGGRMSPLSWSWPVGLGIMLYLSFVVPKETVIVYDEALNRVSEPMQLPRGISTLLWLEKKIENGFVELVYGNPSTAQNVSIDDYRRTAGGIHYYLLNRMAVKPINLPQNLALTLDKYLTDCYMYADMTGVFNRDDVISGRKSFMEAFQASALEPIYTVYYTDNYPGGYTVTCKEAFYGFTGESTGEAVKGIKNELTELANNTDVIADICRDAGMDVSTQGSEKTGPIASSAYEACRGLIEDSIGKMYGEDTSPSIDEVIPQFAIAGILFQAVKAANPAYAVNLKLMSSGLNMGVVANEWIPVMKSVVTAVSLSLIPFLLLFIPTPLVGKAMMAIGGLFTWLCMWGVTDALTHSLAAEYASGVFRSIAKNGPGYKAILFTPDAATKSLAVLGFVRLAGVMLASMMAGIVVKYGGYALASLAGSLSGSLQSVGSQAGAQIIEPPERTRLLEALSHSTTAEMWTNRHSFARQVLQSTYGREVETQRVTDIVSGSGGVTPAVRAVSGASAFHTLSDAAYIRNLAGRNITPEGLALLDTTRVASELRGFENVLKTQYGGNVDNLIGDMARKSGINLQKGIADAKAYGGVIDATAKQLGVSRESAMVLFASSSYGKALGKMHGDIFLSKFLGDWDRYERGEIDFETLISNMAKFRGAGGTLTEEQADHINRTYFHGDQVMQKGMRADFALHPDTGELTYIKAESQDGKRAVWLQNGQMRIVESGVFDVNGRRAEGVREEVYIPGSGLLYGTVDGLIDGVKGKAVYGKNGVVILEGDATQVNFEGLKGLEWLKGVSGAYMSYKGNMYTLTFHGDRTKLNEISSRLRSEGLLREAEMARNLASQLKEGQTVQFEVKGMVAPDGTHTISRFDGVRGGSVRSMDTGSRERRREDIDVTRKEKYRVETGIFVDKDPETGKDTLYYGTRYYDPETGKLVAGSLTNLTALTTTTVRLDEHGNPHYVWARYERGTNGVATIADYRELSHEEIQKGQYAVQRAIGPGGNVIYESGKAGQDILYLHRFIMDYTKKFDFSGGSVIARSGDLTQLSEKQVGTIMMMSQGEAAINGLIKVKSLKEAILDFLGKGKKGPDAGAGVLAGKPAGQKITVDEVIPGGAE